MALYPGVDLKNWVPLPGVLLANTAAGTTMISSEGPDQSVLIFAGATTQNYIYDPRNPEASPVLLPTFALAGSFGVGSCGRWHAVGPSGTALAGSSDSLLKTNLSLLADLRPVGDEYWTGFITGGTGAGQRFEITANTNAAAASVLSVRKPGGGTLDTALDNTSTYILYTGRFYVLNAGTIAAGSFKYFDWATKTMSGNLVVTGLPGTWATDGKMNVTCSTIGQKITITATGGSTTTVVKTGAGWAGSNFANCCQVRCLTGPNAGQIRPVLSNTTDTITVAAFPFAVASGNTFSLEGNDDQIFLQGNSAVTLYRYTLSTTAWSTISPVAARAGAPVAGMQSTWVHSVSTSEWSDEKALLNLRYLFCPRGGTAIIDRFDIAGVTWASDIAYGNKAEVFASGSSASYLGDSIAVEQANTGRIVQLDLPSMSLRSLALWNVTQGAVVLGDKLASIKYKYNGKTYRWLYKWNHTLTTVQRLLLV